MSKAFFYDDNTFVIRVKNKTKVAEHFKQMGLHFKLERHGEGPWHYACQVGNKVLEIYSSPD